MGDAGYAPRRRMFGWGGRGIIALVIVAFGLWRYFSQTEVNPVTGEKQHIALTADQEIALGIESAPEMAAQMGGEVDPSDPAAQKVAQVGAKVVEGSAAKRSPYPYEFHLLRDPETLNAFALPGGQVFITYGLLAKLDDEAQLAGVLGHEVGHVVNRHGAEHMATGQLGQMITMAAGVAGSDDEGGGRRAAMIAAMVNQMVQLKYSRSDELEADRVGMDYMTEAGYDPAAMLGVMRILGEASQGGRPPEMLSTHPYPEQRIEEIQRYLAEHGRGG
ncbi:MAG TPA: M48 family metallopeptidase [Candidatus Polarisedimenticolaceae bacterium]|nr:M48 family metallopeptidase [Candidatus Polarisedimenticolaceae bacterium]